MHLMAHFISSSPSRIDRRQDNSHGCINKHKSGQGGSPGTVTRSHAGICKIGWGDRVSTSRLEGRDVALPIISVKIESFALMTFEPFALMMFESYCGGTLHHWRINKGKPRCDATHVVASAFSPRTSMSIGADNWRVRSRRCHPLVVFIKGAASYVLVGLWPPSPCPVTT